METWISEHLPPLLEKNKIVMDPSCMNYLVERIDHLFNNLCTMIALTVKTQDPTQPKVKPRHLKHMLEYVQHKCYPVKKPIQQGGSYHIDSEYFGKDSGRYYGKTHEDVLNIDFTNGIIRPEIKGGSMAYMEISYVIVENTQKSKLFPDEAIRSQLKSFGVTIEKAPLEILKKIIKLHLNCLMLDLHQHSPITSMKVLEKIFNLKRHAIFF